MLLLTGFVGLVILIPGLLQNVMSATQMYFEKDTNSELKRN